MQDCTLTDFLLEVVIRLIMNRLDRHLSEVIKVKSKGENVDLNDLWRVLQALCFSFFVVAGGDSLDPKHLWCLDA